MSRVLASQSGLGRGRLWLACPCKRCLL